MDNSTLSCLKREVSVHCTPAKQIVLSNWFLCAVSCYCHGLALLSVSFQCLRKLSAALSPQLMWFKTWLLLLRCRLRIFIIHFTLSLAKSAALNKAKKMPQRRAIMFQGFAVTICTKENQTCDLRVVSNNFSSIEIHFYCKIFCCLVQIAFYSVNYLQ